MLPPRRIRSLSLALAASVTVLGALSAGPALADDATPGPAAETSAPAPVPEPEPAPAPAPDPEPAPEPAPAPAPDPEPAPAPEPDPAPAPTPEAEPAPAAPVKNAPAAPAAAGPVVVSGESAISVEATSASGADVPIAFSISGGWSDAAVVVGACAISPVYVDTIAEFRTLSFLGVTFGTSFSAHKQLAVGTYYGACLWAPFTLANLFQFKFHRFTVEVTDPLPTITVPDDLTATATDATGAAVDFTVTADDVIDGDLTPTCTTPGDVPVASGDVFAIGTTTVTCTATNSRAVDATDTFDVTVNAPEPTVTVPASAGAEATGPTGAAVDFTVSGADFVGTALTPVCDLWDGAPGIEVASGATFPLGDTQVRCSVTDTWGATVSDFFMVSVVDTTGPVVTVPEDLTVEASGPDGVEVEFEATAHDAVVGDVPVTCDPASGSTFGLGETTVTCSATDELKERRAPRAARATIADASFTITVVEPEAEPEGEVGGEEETPGEVGGVTADADTLPDTGAPSVTGPLLLAVLLLGAGGALVLRRKA